MAIASFHPNLMMAAGGGVKLGVGAANNNSGHNQNGGANNFKHFSALNPIAPNNMKPTTIQQMLPPSNATVASQQSTKQSSHKTRQSTEGEYQVFKP